MFLWQVQRRDLVSAERDERVVGNAKGFEPLHTAEIGKVDDECRADDISARTPNELYSGLRRSPVAIRSSTMSTREPGSTASS